MRRKLRLMWLFILVVGCVPVHTPPQLESTPGVPVVVRQDAVDFGAFEVRYPAGWRVITGAADQPQNVILVSPDDEALILVTLDPAQQPPMLSSNPVSQDHNNVNSAGSPIQTTRREQPSFGVTLWLVSREQVHNHYLDLLENLVQIAEK